MSKLNVKLENSAVKYLTKNKDNEIVFDFNPSIVNIYKNVLGDLKKVSSVYDVSLVDIFDTKSIQGYTKDNSTSIIPFDQIKECWISNYNKNTQILNLIYK